MNYKDFTIAFLLLIILLETTHLNLQIYVNAKYGKWSGPPDIFFLGVPKGGTTSLHRYLVKHAGVCGGKLKEYHYFTFHHQNEETFRNYQSNYDKCLPHQLTLDGSPSSSCIEARTNLTASYNEESWNKKKWILILREPIDRMHSWYNFQRAKSMENCDGDINCPVYRAKYGHLDTFREYYDNFEFGFVEGFYVWKIKNLLDIISRSQIFIISMQTLKHHSADSLKRIVKFIGANASNYEYPNLNTLEYQLTSLNVTKAKMKCSDYNYYKPIFDAWNEGLYSLINDAKDKPEDEPFFPEFEDKFAKRCAHFSTVISDSQGEEGHFVEDSEVE